MRVIATVDTTIFKLRRDVQLLAQKYGVKIHVSLCEFYVPLSSIMKAHEFHLHKFSSLFASKRYDGFHEPKN